MSFDTRSQSADDAGCAAGAWAHGCLRWLWFVCVICLMPLPAQAEDDPRDLKPKPERLDWVQLVSSEWLTGKIHSMYNDDLEFDSKKLKVLNIDWYDVRTLISHQRLHVLVATGKKTAEVYTGTLKVSGDEVTVTDGKQTHTFHRKQIISFAPAGQRELDLWVLNLGLSLNVQSGNTRKLDYTAKAGLRRRTAKTKLVMDYIGNISSAETVAGTLAKTANNHRLTTRMDVFINRRFFYTPFNGEFYRDPFRNINQRITIGAGAGYFLYNSKEMTWDVSLGPSFVSTRFESVQQSQKARENSVAVVGGTHLEAELTSKLDLDVLYNINASKKKSGGYSHHMIVSLENEVTKRMDVDVSFLWDRIVHPTVNENGILPKSNDFRLTVGLKFTID